VRGLLRDPQSDASLSRWSSTSFRSTSSFHFLSHLATGPHGYGQH